MSIDENNNETGTSDQPEAVKPVEPTPPTEPVAPAASSTPPAAEAVTAGAGGALAGFLALQQSNPKVFYGAIGGVVLLILIFVFSGGSDAKLPVHQAKPVVIGQNYVLKSPNAYDNNATIRLVAVPGSMAAYDDTEENDREGGCKHILQGTPVKVTQSQDAYGKKDVFVEVEMLGGECEGKKGWALAINLQ
ncbi:hypothetical protein KEF85_02875 [Methylomonas paludis]|uniref:Uncharacterized protein n=1 Tax=Methylomonas paludis TaxID=1173101 RepID=A0A975MPK3_9GAMM|nr:hypothetical protein [Methylomonas paludis]QWF71445.1 hypothetical protein KEF85_02875 [Methylomonas paludis]